MKSETEWLWLWGPFEYCQWATDASQASPMSRDRAVAYAAMTGGRIVEYRG